MATVNYFAVTNANGLISQALLATTLAGARAEVRAAVSEGASVNWINDAWTDLEDACDCCCDGLSYSDALALCHANGAEFEFGDSTGDTWDIWSVSEEL